MSEGYQMPRGVVFSLQILTVDVGGGERQFVTQSNGKVYVADSKTFEEAYWELRRKVTAG